jgi:hypothetical protein
VAKAEAENMVPIPLGGGQTLNFPMSFAGEEEPLGQDLDLDDEQLEKLR